jgi:hypothetical protein
VYLFSKKFLSSLADHLPGAVDGIDRMIEWSIDLSTRRDPAAHRIPLQVPRTVFSATDEERFKTIEEESAALMKGGRYREGMQLWNTVDKLGSFQPILVQSGAEGPTTVDLHAQIAADHDRFLTLAESVIEQLCSAVGHAQDGTDPRQLEQEF